MAVAANPLDEPLKGRSLLLTGIILAFANFLVVLDTTIANVSIPNIAGGLSVSPTQGAWVITSYAVADAITVPLAGWLAARYGPVRVFATAMMMFAFWSFICGLAHTLELLIAARVMQGLSGGPMIPLSQTLLLRVFGKARSGAATGIWAVTTLLAPVIGPILGGEICDRFSWPWIFYVNVPIAAGCAFAAWRLLGGRDDRPVNVPVDFIGLLLLVVWVGAFQITLDKGRELDWFASPFIVTLVITAVIGLISFVIWECTAENPVVDLSVFLSPSFRYCTLVISLGFAAFFSGWIILPLWLQVNMGYTATIAGRAFSLNGVLAVLVAPLVAFSLRYIDTRILVTFGLVLAAGTMVLRTGFASNITFWGVGSINLLQGMAMPFFFLPLVGLSLVDFEGPKVAAAAGIVSFMRSTAGAFGASMVLTEWDHATGVARSDIVRSMTNGGSLVQKLQQQGFSIEQARAQLENIVNGQAVMQATIHIFYVLAAVLSVAATLIWLVPRPQKPVGMPAAH
jgi:DHA2 family multidrug resistance protein